MHWDVDESHINGAFTYTEKSYEGGNIFMGFQEFTLNASHRPISGLFKLDAVNSDSEKSFSFAINVHATDDFDGDHPCQQEDIDELETDYIREPI